MGCRVREREGRLTSWLLKAASTGADQAKPGDTWWVKLRGWRGLGEGRACKALSGKRLADAPGEGSQGPWAKRGARGGGPEDWQGLRKERKDVGKGIGQTQCRRAGRGSRVLLSAPSDSDSPHPQWR